MGFEVQKECKKYCVLYIKKDKTRKTFAMRRLYNQIMIEPATIDDNDEFPNIPFTVVCNLNPCLILYTTESLLFIPE